MAPSLRILELKKKFSKYRLEAKRNEFNITCSLWPTEGLMKLIDLLGIYHFSLEIGPIYKKNEIIAFKKRSRHYPYPYDVPLPVSELRTMLKEHGIVIEEYLFSNDETEPEVAATILKAKAK